MSSIDISIILATKDRKNLLKRFVSYVRGLDNLVNVELIIVDNGSTDSTSDYLKHLSLTIPVLILKQPLAGKSRALNFAIKHATGNLIVFTDDDVILKKNWLNEIFHATKKYPKANIFGGKIDIDIDKIPAWIRKSYNLRTLLTSEQNLGENIYQFKVNEYPVGPNIVIRRSGLMNIEDPWPVDFGPGMRIPVGDEVAFLQKISPPDSRDRIYVPTIHVIHKPVIYYSTFLDALRRCYYGGLAAGIIIIPFKKNKLDNGITYILGCLYYRFKAMKSLKEMACVIARLIGYLLGRYY